MQKSKLKSYFRLALFSLLLMVLLAACGSSTPEATPEPTAPPTPEPTAEPTLEPTPEPVLETSTDMILAAWTALNNQEYATAAEYAQLLIDTFSEEAEQQQNALSDAPPLGTVTDAAKEAIFENWALNDVGTAYFILGRAQVNLGDNDAARQAFETAGLYPFARCWDPQGWFWSPAFGAEEELGKLP